MIAKSVLQLHATLRFASLLGQGERIKGEELKPRTRQLPWKNPHPPPLPSEWRGDHVRVRRHNRSNLLVTDDVMTPRSRNETSDHSSTLDETSLQRLEF